MKRAMIPAFALLALPVWPQDPPKERVVDEAKGFSISKPKGEEWKVTEGGENAKVYKETQAVVSHRIDELTIEVLITTKGEREKWAEYPDIAHKFVEQLGQKDGKAIEGRKVKTRKDEKAKFPGNGQPNAWFLDLEVRDNDKVGLTLRYWLFVDKQNPHNLVNVFIVASDEIYKKYQKEIALVLSGLQTFKAKKK